jgi:hypothetical protein
MKHAQSQEYEDQEEDLEELYNLEQIAQPRPAPKVGLTPLHIPALLFLSLVCALLLAAIVLGLIDEVRFFWRSFR